MNMKKNIIAIIVVVLAVFIIILAIFKFTSSRYSNTVDEINDVYSSFEEMQETTEESSEVSTVEVEETETLFPDIDRRHGLDDDAWEETANNDNTPIASYDYSDLEYWQQNALNTIAKTISSCSDDEEVEIVGIDMSGDVGSIVVRKNGEEYSAEFDKNTFGIIQQNQ